MNGLAMHGRPWAQNSQPQTETIPGCSRSRVTSASGSNRWRLKGGAVVEVASGGLVLGQGPGPIASAGLEGGNELDLVCQAVLQREQARKQIAGGDEGGHKEILPGDRYRPWACWPPLPRTFSSPVPQSTSSSSKGMTSPTFSPRWAVGRSRIMFARVGHIDRSRLSER
jgi:hypothetical protein